MSVRLGFAVAVQVDADILLVDEVLAVGDAAFQQKCFEQFQALKDAGQDDRLRHPRHVGGRALLRPRDAAGAAARCVELGDPHDVARAYNQLNFGRIVARRRRGRALRRPLGRDRARLVRGRELQAPARAPLGRVLPRRRRGQVPRGHGRPDLLLGAAQRLGPDRVRRPPRTTTTAKTGAFAAGESVVVRTGFAMRLAGNRYTLSPSVARAGTGMDIVDVREDLATLLVHSHAHHRRRGRPRAGLRPRAPMTSVAAPPPRAATRARRPAASGR